MGIVAYCPHGHRVKVKDHLAGRKGICPECGSSFRIPRESQPAPPVPLSGSSLGVGMPGSAGPPSPAKSAGGLPVATIVSLDATLAASLPRALPLAAPGRSPGG
jgi:hypothetical protein